MKKTAGGTEGTLGCERCRAVPTTPEDLAIISVRIVWDSSHSSFELSRCESCGQSYLKQFHEILDPNGGPDDIWIRWMPLTDEEEAGLDAISENWNELKELMHRRGRLVHDSAGKFHWDSIPWDAGDLMPPG